jgi:uncharacterized protein (DUF983 family)
VHFRLDALSLRPFSIRGRFFNVIVRPPLRSVLPRALRLRCPHCGEGGLFRGILAVRSECDRCGLAFFRESGYFVGSMYVNVVLTEIIMAAAYIFSLFLPPLFHFGWMTEVALWMCAAVVVSLSLTRWTRSFWLAVDFWIEPWTPAQQRISLSEGSLR